MTSTPGPASLLVEGGNVVVLAPLSLLRAFQAGHCASVHENGPEQDDCGVVDFFLLVLI